MRTTENGVVYLVDGAHKIALFPRIPKQQFDQIVDAAKDLPAMKADLETKATGTVRRFRMRLQTAQAEQHKIVHFEQITAAKQASVARWYREALQRLIDTATQVISAHAIACLVDGIAPVAADDTAEAASAPATDAAVAANSDPFLDGLIAATERGEREAYLRAHLQSRSTPSGAPVVAVGTTPEPTTAAPAVPARKTRAAKGGAKKSRAAKLTEPPELGLTQPAPVAAGEQALIQAAGL